MNADEADLIIIKGQKEDIESLKNAMIEGGFDVSEGDNYVRAADPTTIAARATLVVVMVKEISKCIQAHLKARGKRLIKYEKDGTKILIRGDFSTERIDEILKCCYMLGIEDDISETSDSPPKEIGFHTGIKPPPDDKKQ